MKYASALSEHPITAQAVGEAAGQILEKAGRGADLALVFVTPPHAGALEDTASAVASILDPAVVLGCAAEAVLGTSREVEGSPAVSIWVGHTGAVVPIELGATGPTPPSAGPPAGWPPGVPEQAGALLLFADPFSFATDEFLAWVASAHPDLSVVGGHASGAMGPGGNRLVVGGSVRTDGAVGAFLPAAAGVRTAVSQGCRPIGRPLVATKAEGSIVFELAGRPAMQRLLELVEQGLPEADIRAVNQGGLQLGRVIDEHKVEFGRGDFLVRNVVGADRSNGAIALTDPVDVGTTVQFHLRDASAADEDLRSLLAGEVADAALVFTCNGRGTRLFGVPDHDARAVADSLGPVPVAGFFAAGELGPVGGRNFLHGFTASLALFGERAATASATG